VFRHPFLPLALLLTVVACGRGNGEAPAGDAAPAPPAVADQPLPIAEVTDAAELRRTSRLLAGLGVEGEVGHPAVWERHAEAMDEIWSELEARHLKPMRRWAAGALASAGPDAGSPDAGSPDAGSPDAGSPDAGSPDGLGTTPPLFYPFGGPDLASAVQFFPDARSYLLVGLEPPGKVPELAGLDGEVLEAELGRLRGGLRNLVQAGYFVTTQMERDFAVDASLDGFLPLFYLFLARTGYTPASVRYVTFDDSGTLHPPARVTAATARGVEIRFVPAAESDGDGDDGDGDGGDGTSRTVYYFARDLSDSGLAADPGLPRFLDRLQGFHVYMKSASYLLHMPELTTLRELLLERATAILQDDSGIPFRDFDPDRWRVELFGGYTGTLPNYRQWFQEDLQRAFADTDAEPLPFAIGYNRNLAGSGLIWARRRSVDAARWPQLRGPEGDGQAPWAELPLRWGEGENVAWKVPVPGRGFSSPVVLEGRVWLTTALEEERSLRALAFDLETGAALHDVEVFRPAEWRPIHLENSYASPTPAAEEGRVYVHFGSYGTAALNAADGSVLWRSDDLDIDHEVGPGSSPILHRDLLIVNCDGTDQRFVAALHKETGEVAWRAPRSVPLDKKGPHLKAFSTPLVIRHDGREELISPGAGQVSAYRPLTGEEIWRVRYEGYSNVPMPVAGLGRVFVDTGYVKPHLLSIRLGGRGDVTDSHVEWSYHWQVPANPTPLLIGDRLYMVNDWGKASWLDARRGEDLWRQRLGGRYYASPLHARGRIYNFGVDGESPVLAAGDEFRELARNRLDGEIRATPAVAGDALVVRTDRHLYRIEG